MVVPRHTGARKFEDLALTQPHILYTGLRDTGYIATWLLFFEFMAVNGIFKLLLRLSAKIGTVPYITLD